MIDYQKPLGSGFGARSTATDVLVDIDLPGKRAIVTGGHSGLGLETTKALTASGAQVVVAARNPAAAAVATKDVVGDLLQRLTSTLVALQRDRAARNRHHATRARHDMRTWQVERRKRTRQLIELGGLVVKAGIVEPTGDNRAVILGALLWTADKLQSDQGEHARALWAAKGKQASRDD